MRDYINVLWVEDTQNFYDEEKEILEIFASENGIKIDFEYISDAETFLRTMEQQKAGFQKFDICFIDYNLSMQSGKFGDTIINKLREYDVCTDILFYSEGHFEDIISKAKENFFSFEGVYVTNRENFEGKSFYLIKKNAKKLYSINNIRGFLMNETSENDYIVKSYILKKYPLLKKEEKIEIDSYLRDVISKKENRLSSQIGRALTLVNGVASSKIKNILECPSDVLPLKEIYEVFRKVLTYTNANLIDNNLLNDYLSSTIPVRNKLAHRKLEVCKSNKQIMHYNTILDFEKKSCQHDCTDQCIHPANNKVDVQEWENIKKRLKNIGEQFDELYDSLSVPE